MRNGMSGWYIFLRQVVSPLTAFEISACDVHKENLA